jgi:hypothetical protein
VFSNVAGTWVGESVRLTVTAPGAPPNITYQPVSHEACAGIPVLLIAEAVGDSSLTVQWQVSTDGGNTWANDTTDSGATTDGLSIANPSRGDEYRAVFTDAGGTSITQPAVIEGVYAPPPVLVGDTEVFAGQTAELQVPDTAGCYFGQLTNWQSASPGSSTYTTIEQYGPTTLTIANATVAESGTSYSATIQNGSDPTFTGALSVYPVPTPTGQTVAAGGTATFTAPTSFTLPSAWSVQWQVSTDGGNTWANDTGDAGATTQTLTVAGATASENGFEYRAAITNAAGTVDTSAATLTVTPPAHAPTVTRVTPNSGGSFSLVLIGGTNLTQVRSVSFGSQKAVFLALSSKLIIALAPSESAGTVDVTVTTKAGTSATSTADRFTYR